MIFGCIWHPKDVQLHTLRTDCWRLQVRIDCACCTHIGSHTSDLSAEPRVFRQTVEARWGMCFKCNGRRCGLDLAAVIVRTAHLACGQPGPPSLLPTCCLSTHVLLWGRQVSTGYFIPRKDHATAHHETKHIASAKRARIHACFLDNCMYEVERRK